VNPGGIEAWKQGVAGRETDLDQLVPHFDVTPRQILSTIAQAADELALPHPVHIHANNLGVPGNWTTTLETMKLLEGRRGHLTHIQFHSYGGKHEDDKGFCSQVTPLADYVNTHKNITVDVGQILFGRTVSMTADSPVGQYLAQLAGAPWISHDVELESGCGVSPIEYKDRNLVNAWQWAAGLEWYLLVQDPWRVAMSTDHPNGGSFLAYPQVIRLLMDGDYRREVLQSTPERVRERSLLRDLDREYTLQEIAIITRAGPARMLGLAHKGHLGVGADADLAIYTPNPNWATMFEIPRYVIKGGRIILEEGSLRASPFGATCSVAPEYDRDAEPDIVRWLAESSSLHPRNFAVADQHERASS
jgi:formylmethanofuran dehydrogenase subunit A